LVVRLAGGVFAAADWPLLDVADLVVFAAEVAAVAVLAKPTDKAPVPTAAPAPTRPVTVRTVRRVRSRCAVARARRKERE